MIQTIRNVTKRYIYAQTIGFSFPWKKPPDVYVPHLVFIARRETIISTDKSRAISKKNDATLITSAVIKNPLPG